MVVGLEIEVTVGVRRFSVDLCHHTFSSLDQDIQKWDGSFILQFHGKLDAVSLVVQVVEEFVQSVFTMVPHNESIVHIP